MWKLFGDERVLPQVMEAVRSGRLNREQARSQYGCVVSVQDVSFTVAPGELFCVMGLSGSGKSTLIRHVNRLIEPTSGDILIGDQSVCSLNTRALRTLRAGRVGMVFQNMALLPHRSVESNVGLALELRSVKPDLRAEVVERVLGIVGLSGWGARQVSELSGGMQQRVGLARALAADPEILLMDEPFSALDPLIRRQLQDEFKRLSRVMGKTTLFITHDLEEAIRIGDRIGIMKDGQLVQVGTPAQIIMSPATEFVAEFVKGISRLNILRAQDVMTPQAEFVRQHSGNVDDLQMLPTVGAETLLRDLIKVAAHDQRPIAVKQGDTQVGVIPHQVLFSRVLEGLES